MKHIRPLVWNLMFLSCTFNVLAQLDQNRPAIGYVYPAGAKQGATIQISAGGQFLRGANDVYISGSGVTGKVIKHIRPFRNLNGDQRRELQRRLKAVRDQRILELPPKQREDLGFKNILKNKKKAENETAKKKEDETNDVKLPDHPLLEDLENKSFQELAHIAYHLRFPRNKLQLNRQISEIVLIEITVAADAKPGSRELRINTRAGLTNPVVFQVGVLPEINELEPNDGANTYIINNLFQSQKTAVLKDYLRPEPMDLPVLINGQIMPGDVDRFRFHAKTGQQLVINALARSLIPYLADAVPGWFQATVTLYNAAGNEMAFADDYRFDPDPVLFYKIPRDGIYELEIRDSIYRGRQDFIYRVAIGELPFITRMFPLGGKEDTKTIAVIDGWNLTTKELTLDTRVQGQSIRRTMVYDTKTASNSVPYAVDTLSECTETENNDTIEQAEEIRLGKIINGKIASVGDVDVFKFKANEKQQIVAEVYARRLNSPLDSILKLTDVSGNVIKWNDDHVLKDSYLYKDIVGLMTHHADSYLMAKIPTDETYYVHLTDSQNHGSSAHAYRLRLTQAQPDFALRVIPSSLSFTSGSIQPVTVHVLRKDGFDGEIKMALKDTPGFKLDGGRIPAGCDRVHMTVAAPAKPDETLVHLKMEGYTKIGNQEIHRTAVPADDVMQAFLYRHLVPAQELLATVRKVKWPAPPVEVVGDKPIKLTAGGTAEVTLKTRKRPVLNEIRLELYQPPKGITLEDVKVVEEGLTFKLNIQEECLADGFEDNLIIEAYREFIPKDKEGKPTGPQRRNWVGVMPAVPIQIVHKTQKDSDQGQNKNESTIVSAQTG